MTERAANNITAMSALIAGGLGCITYHFIPDIVLCVGIFLIMWVIGMFALTAFCEPHE